MRLFIKYMVCLRCKMLVQGELDKLGLHCVLMNLGEVDIAGRITPAQRDALGTALLTSGLELVEDKKSSLIERIKHAVVQMVHYAPELPRIKNSDYLSQKLKHNYTYLANMFSVATGNTIEHFIIAHKIERVKELLLYDEHNLTQISYILNYSSVAHLSNQFKKVTGFTPSIFKNGEHRQRTALDNV